MYISPIIGNLPSKTWLELIDFKLIHNLFSVNNSVTNHNNRDEVMSAHSQK